MDKIYIDNEEYRYVELRGRGKYISKTGKAVNPKRRNQQATIHYNTDKYPCFGGGVPVHLYVAHGWVDGFFEGAEVNHKDFNRDNYNANNLEWVTHLDNVKYTLTNNYATVCDSKRGVNNGMAKMSENEVLHIRELYDGGMRISDIVKLYYPQYTTVQQYKKVYSTFANIAKRKTWKHL